VLIFYTDQDKKQKQKETGKYEKTYYPFTVIAGNPVKIMSSMFVGNLIHKNHFNSKTTIVPTTPEHPGLPSP
jgi:hypothetical protein